ncbi:SDR family NAD(P)-dependent oxidoreductase [Muriicola sp. Z0-33]|uniref:SDR family NAD(P)-dependent oxidoreductase n=1 Tax=Muriicola sp. Z0-33 TaxID=2816957 RepID=UPI0022383618|nr:SDR family oxidoreductase [Muriicola sp. Z0-33]MCW5515253.1 SDR family oxidoreductase [Muriicola sp. Z0-33]
MQLKNKVILITGGYTGIGKAIVERCIQEGAKILANGLRKEKGEELVKQLDSDRLITHAQDITEEGTPKRLIEVALKNYGKLDAVVNNAAIIRPSNIGTTDMPFLKRMLEVNTIAPFAIIQAALPYLTKTKGCVLNIGSINAWSGEPNLLAYSISKGALMTMSRNLGDTLFRENGVRVNQINPGWVLTDNEFINQKEQGKKDDWHLNLPEVFAPAKRLFKPEELATAALYLLSDQCGPVSGQVLEVEQFPMIGRNMPKEW